MTDQAEPSELSDIRRCLVKLQGTAAELQPTLS